MDWKWLRATEAIGASASILNDRWKRHISMEIAEPWRVLRFHFTIIDRSTQLSSA